MYLVDIFKMDVLRSRDPLEVTFYFVDMELCAIDLQKFLQIPTFTGESNIWKIMFQIASGVQFVHDKGLVVRDLRPSRG